MHDAIVVGAGLAGAVAARELAWRGRRVLILEARTRPGGRAHRVVVEGRPLELGGAYVHWRQPHVWAEITRYGLPVVAPSVAATTAVRLLTGNGPVDLHPDVAFAALAGASDAFFAAAPDAGLLFPRPFDAPCGEWEAVDSRAVGDVLAALELPSPGGDLLAAMLATDGSAPPADVALLEPIRLRALVGSADPLALAEVSGGYMLEDGSPALLDVILSTAAVELRMGMPVARVAAAADRVVVDTVDGDRHEARAAVVAVPLNTLDRIEFAPPLTTALVALAGERHAGAGVKLFVRARGVPRGFFGLAPPPGPLSLLAAHAEDGDGTWLVGFGPSAALLDVADRAAVATAVGRFLPEATIATVVGHDWVADPFARGAWCVLRPGQLRRLRAGATTPHPRLHLAGADFARGWRGFLDGAIETGLDAGRRIHGVLA